MPFFKKGKVYISPSGRKFTKEKEIKYGSFKNKTMKIIEKKIEELKPYEKNAKIHDKKQISLLKENIKKFGFTTPLLISDDNEIIAGHGRLTAIKELDYKTVPCVLMSGLTKEEISALRLADNQINMMTGFDMNLVIDELKGLSDEMFELTGFDKDLILGTAELGWNPQKTEEAEIGDGINEKVGYGLQSFWKDIKNENSELYKHWIELPVQQTQNLIRQKYSRTNLEEIRRVIKTYMRGGDYFLENCCGWSTFSCSAVLHGFNGIGVDIWNKSIEHGKKQYNAISSLDGVGKYEIILADGMNLPFEDNKFDFVYCNPPFMDEEKYSGLENDIAEKDFGKFAEKFIKLQKENYRVLKPNNLCVITINDKREKGYLIPIQKYVIEWSEKAGFKLWDFVIAEVESQKIRLRKKDYELRRTVKYHEYVIVFKKCLTK